MAVSPCRMLADVNVPLDFDDVFGLGLLRIFL
jgi:hypothetical protein